MDQNTNSTPLDSGRMDFRELLAWSPSALIYGGLSYLAMLLLF